ncbi:MAG: hypothetical protein ACFFFT_19095 [Candidatus Thorarchaeota archaeon]
MDEIKNIVDDIGIAAFEANTKIAGIAVISDSGNLVFQTENFDLTNQTDFISNVINGDRSFVYNNVEFKVVETSATGFFATNDSGMGHLIIVPFQGGILVAYAMPGADSTKTLNFLNSSAMKLNGKI